MGKNTKKKGKGNGKLNPVPPAAPTTETGWSDLPPELHEMILDKLGWDNKWELINRRQVNLSWKGMIDSILERRVLSVLTEWDPIGRKYEDDSDDDNWWDNDEDDVQKSYGWKRATDAKAKKLRTIWSWFEENSSDSSEVNPNFDHDLPDVPNPKMGTPIPTNSLKIRFDDDVWPDRGRFIMSRRVQMLIDFMEKYDHCFSYLTSLLLSHIQLKPSDLSGILGFVKNLKSLTLEEITFLPEEREVEVQLPPIPNLAHLRITSKTKNGAQFLLNAYHEQLINLELNSWALLFPTPYKNLQKLKLMKVSEPDLNVPQIEQSHFPALKCLSVVIRISEKIFEWDELSKFIDPFPKTLTALYLDIVMRKKTDDDVLKQLTSSGVTFPELKTIGVLVPKTFQHAECLRKLIFPKFPKAEELNLIVDYNKYPIIYSVEEQARLKAEREVRKQVVRELSEKPFLAKVCPKLDNINII